MPGLAMDEDKDNLSDPCGDNSFQNKQKSELSEEK